MLGSGSGILFLLCVIHLVNLGQSDHGEILWGQCHAYCLTQYQPQSTLSQATRAHSKFAIRSCRRDKRCKWCLSACERPQKDYHDDKNCKENCLKHTTRHISRAGVGSCEAGCHFLSTYKDVKVGTCPEVETLSTLRQSCIQECNKDSECSHSQKCCLTSCGRICHMPNLPQSVALPEQPRQLYFKERKDGGLLVKWEAGKTNETLAVVYILRWWCGYTRGVLYSITSKHRVKLSGYPDGVHPATRCHYMVAGVSVDGSHGFTLPVMYIKHFLVPSPPLNLEGTKRKLKDSKVDVTVQWQPPKLTDQLPVNRYLIFWSDALPRAGTSYTRLHMHRKTINAARTSFTIVGLEPGVLYFIQVRAVVSWKGKSIRGKPASTYLESFSRPVPAQTDDKTARQVHIYPTDSRIHGLSVDRLAVVDSQLTAVAAWSLFSGSGVKHYVVYWTLDVCDEETQHRKALARITEETTTYQQQLQLQGLHPSCVYELRVHTEDLNGQLGPGRRKFFKTPSCEELMGAAAICKNQTLLPPRITGVVHKKLCHCPALVSWLPSGEMTSPDNRSYTVIWGESRPAPSTRIDADDDVVAVIYNSKPYSTVVSGRALGTCLDKLQPLTHYTVQVVAQQTHSHSKPAVKHFKTHRTVEICHLQQDEQVRKRPEEETTSEQMEEKLLPKQLSSHNCGNIWTAQYLPLALVSIAVCTLTFFIMG